jgi:hypothetical protein
MGLIDAEALMNHSIWELRVSGVGQPTICLSREVNCFAIPFDIIVTWVDPRKSLFRIRVGVEEIQGEDVHMGSACQMTFQLQLVLGKLTDHLIGVSGSLTINETLPGRASVRELTISNSIDILGSRHA